MIQRRINANLAPNLSSKDIPFIQKYSSHPFLDVYGIECDKGLAFNSVLSQLKQEEIANVMYLGDLRLSTKDCIFTITLEIGIICGIPICTDRLC